MLVRIYPEDLLVVKMCLELQLRRKKTKFCLRENKQFQFRNHEINQSLRDGILMMKVASLAG